MVGYRVQLQSPLPGFVWADAAEIRSGYALPTALRAYQKQL